MINLPEIIIIIVIIAIVFGFGKLSGIGKSIGKAGKDLKDGLKEGMSDEKDKPINITPDLGEEESFDPKPGTKKQPVEDAEIDA